MGITAGGIDTGVTVNSDGSATFDAHAFTTSVAAQAGLSPDQVQAGSDLVSLAGGWSGMSEQQQTDEAFHATEALAAALAGPVIGGAIAVALEGLHSVVGDAHEAPDCCQGQGGCPHVSWQDWAPSHGNSRYEPPSTAFEQFAYATIKAACERAYGDPCKVGNGAPPFHPLLLLAQCIGAWNATHASTLSPGQTPAAASKGATIIGAIGTSPGGPLTSQALISRDISQGDFQHGFGSPDGDPVTVALTQLGTNGRVSFTVNTGPALPTLLITPGDIRVITRAPSRSLFALLLPTLVLTGISLAGTFWINRRAGRRGSRHG
jgi:hypothetical protein